MIEAVDREDQKVTERDRENNSWRARTCAKSVHMGFGRDQGVPLLISCLKLKLKRGCKVQYLRVPSQSGLLSAFHSKAGKNRAAPVRCTKYTHP